MSRYADWNSFIKNLKVDKYGETNVNEVGIAFEKATADVVPKSEVDLYRKQVDELEDELATLQKEMENTKHA